MSGDTTTVPINSKLIELSGPEPDVADTKYWLIHLQDSTLESLQEVQDAGVTLISHRGENVYLCRYTSTDLDRLRGALAVKSINRYPASAKIHQDLEEDIKVLRDNSSEADTGSSANSVPIAVNILLHEGEPEEAANLIAQELVADGRAQAKDTTSGPGLVTTVVSSDALSSIAAFESVHVISPQSEKDVSNNLCCEILSAEYPQLWPQKNNAPENNTVFDGSGEIVAVGDTGFDNGTAWSSKKDIHPAFNPDKIAAGFCPFNPKPKKQAVMEDLCGHGTHVAASAVGFAQSPSPMAPGGRRIQGTAPGASLVITQLADNKDKGRLRASDANGVFKDAYNAGARVFNESWGSLPMKNGKPYGYDKAKWIDEYIVNQPNAMVCWAAGNDGRKRNKAQRIGAEASAKNTLTVGACHSSRLDDGSGTYAETGSPGDAGTIWEGSSVGFVFDSERIKPDVVAPGHLILSARSRSLSGEDLKDVDDRGKSTDASYMFLSGTSMASPLVAGCAAVLRQAVKALKPTVTNPSSALIKALIINGAVPLVPKKSKKGFYVPDYNWGFGRVNLQASLQHLQKASGGSAVQCGIVDDIMPSGSKGGKLVAEVTVGHGQTIDLTEELMRPRLKATLVYIDKADDLIQYRLYLKVSQASKQSSYWYGNRAKRTKDDKDSQRGDCENNVQQVIWPNLAPDTYRIEVETDPKQANWAKVPFAVAWFLSGDADSAGQKQIIE
ncbi:hypothetical protein FGADI_3314 [Fusarium gaditjirri]|uniref:Peptidase S8/S53 domain-containing protein n=1 Tax=Fusarium gaditjirri TaxID=282569 RepID=A0A8H4X0T6_9HYPO|nr:hypothetical protein FGADI_3314 [Fusarium gaditjirri]